MSLLDLLPAPKHAVAEEPRRLAGDGRQSGGSSAGLVIPPYGRRSLDSFQPRTADSFGDGGAFPELDMLQYPRDMGRPAKAPQNQLVSVEVDGEGRVRYDAIVRQGVRKDRNVITARELVAVKDYSKEELSKPSLEEEQAQLEAARQALSLIADKQMSNNRAAAGIVQPSETQATYVRYTPSDAAPDVDTPQQRIIRIQPAQVDPLEPPKFRHLKAPRAAPSPPVPVMHSPPRKVTYEDQQNWKIPPCISNWKNVKGYTIPLDKRVAADGRGLETVQVNDKFAVFAESLFVAERTARKDIELRAELQKQLLRKQQEAKEEELRQLAAQARARAAFGDTAGSTADRDEESYGRAQEQREGAGEDSEDSSSGSDSDSDSEDEPGERRPGERDDEYYEREQLRRERMREIKRKYRQEQIKNEKRKAQIKEGSRYARESERDVSEKIALGQQVARSQDSLFDSRLFSRAAESQAAGTGADDAYNLYDKPLFGGSSANMLYRPKAQDADSYGGADDLQKVLEAGSSRFSGAAGRAFKGTEGGLDVPRDKPVAFEMVADELVKQPLPAAGAGDDDEDDPFNLAGILGGSSDQSRRRGTLDHIGSRGHMAAAGGAADPGSLSRRAPGLRGPGMAAAFSEAPESPPAASSSADSMYSSRSAPPQPPAAESSSSSFSSSSSSSGSRHRERSSGSGSSSRRSRSRSSDRRSRRRSRSRSADRSSRRRSRSRSSGRSSRRRSRSRSRSPDRRYRRSSRESRRSRSRSHRRR